MIVRYSLPAWRWPAARSWLTVHAAASDWRDRPPGIPGTVLLELSGPELRERLHAHLQQALGRLAERDAAATLRVLPTQELKLYIGWGVPPPGFTVYRPVPGAGIDLVGPTDQLGQIPDGCCAEVHADGVLHRLFPGGSAARAVVEFGRVLVAGGRLLVRSPDLAELSTALLAAGRDRVRRDRLLQTMSGAGMQAGPAAAAFDAKDIAEIMVTARFERVGQIAGDGMATADASADPLPYLYLEGWKPVVPAPSPTGAA